MCGGQAVDQDGSFKISKADPARLVQRFKQGSLKLDIRLLAYLKVKLEARSSLDKKIYAYENPYPDWAPSRKRWYGSRLADLTPTERQWVADGLRAWRREVRASRARDDGSRL
jgi:hypothetical protein